MKSSEILREAARLVERGFDYGGCWAVVKAAGAETQFSLSDCVSGSPKAQAALNYLNKASPLDRRGYWWDDDGPRIIGLCLAAAIAESEGD